MDALKLRAKMNEEVLFWARYNYAISSFCFEQTSSSFRPEKIISSFVGEELEWCGSQSFLFLANRVLDSQKKLKDLESRCKAAENLLQSEALASNSLRKQVKTLQRNNEDSEWSLQEQIAHLNAQNLNEQELNRDLTQKLNECTDKLNELTQYLDTHKDRSTTQLEIELFEHKKQIIELMAEKEDFLRKLEKSKKKSYIPTTNSKGGLTSRNLKNINIVSSTNSPADNDLTRKIGTSDSLGSATSYYSMVSDENTL